VAVAPQPLLSRSYEPPEGPAPLSGLWLGLAALVLAIVSVATTVSKEIAARWRGIVVAHLFFLTLWLAIQVFFFATGAYWCLPGNSSRFLERMTRSFSQVARCGPVLQGPSAFQGSIAVAAPAPASSASPAVSTVPAAPPIPAPTAPPPSADPQASDRGAGWSAKAIANCWRDRSVRSGNCYEPAVPRRSRGQPPVRYGRPEPSSPYPCRRPYDCWPDNSRRYDL
jgi:hypothetical protein